MSDDEVYSEGIASDLGDLYGGDDSGEESMGEQEISGELEQDSQEYSEELENEDDLEIEDEDEEEDQLNELNELLRKMDQGIDFNKLQYLTRGVKKSEKKQCEKLIRKVQNQKEISEQKQEYLNNDEEELSKQLQELQKSVLENNTSYLGQYKLLKKKQGLEVSEGLGFLNAKSLIFQEYLINLHFYLLKKIQGEDLEAEFVKKLLYQKTLLQKMKPVEKKLEYQIQKLLKFSQKKQVTKKDNKVYNPYDDEEDEEEEEEQQQQQDKKELDIEDGEEADEEDPYNFKPNPNNFVDSSEGEDEDEKKGGKKQKKYVAPKLVSALSKDDKLAESVRRKEDRRKDYLRRQLVDTLGGDDGINMKESKNLQHSRRIVNRQEKEKEQYELEHFTRLPTTKKDKAQERKIQKQLQHGGERLDDFTEEKQIRELLSYENIIDKKSNLKSIGGFNNNNKRKQQFKGIQKGGKKKFKK